MARPEIAIIVGRARNGVIGRDNRLPWRLRDDLQQFKRRTLGHPVIMGRKTWESLPDAFRPLPGRRNIVISRNSAYEAPGATLAGSLDEAVRLTQDDAEVFVIGGAEIYRQALPLAQRLYLTEVAQDFAADVFFPEFGAREWREISRSAMKNGAGLDFTFAVYQRA